MKNNPLLQEIKETAQKGVAYWQGLSRDTKVKTLKISVGTLVILLAGYELGRWRAGRYFDEQLERVPRAYASENGRIIHIPKNSPAREVLQVINSSKGNASLRVTAPARVVAVSSASPRKDEHVILFDSPDVTSLFSQYRQAKANFLRSSKNFERTKDMFANEAATGKELNDAENDLSAAKAVLVENEVKLRTVGFDPENLEKLKAKTALLISDIPETQISEVQKGEDVKLEFASMPEAVIVGKADSIGDAIDPVTRTIKVKVLLANPKGRIMPGMFAKADFGAYENDIVVIPSSALISVEEKNFVFVAKSDEEFERRQVTVASARGENIVVIGGLAQGERVVSKGAMLLKGLSFSL